MCSRWIDPSFVPDNQIPEDKYDEDGEASSSTLESYHEVLDVEVEGLHPWYSKILLRWVYEEASDYITKRRERSPTTGIAIIGQAGTGE